MQRCIVIANSNNYISECKKKYFYDKQFGMMWIECTVFKLNI